MVLPFTVASADGSQYRCLYPSEGIVAKARRLAHGIAGVDSENPVRLVAAVGSKEQAVVATVRLQVFHAFTHRLVGKRRNPQTEARLCTVQVLIDIAECHFPVTAGIGSRNDGVTCLKHPLDYFKLEHGINLRYPSVLGACMTYHQFKFGRDERKVIPFQLLGSVVLRHGQ